jgi:hypothetical protein
MIEHFKEIWEKIPYPVRFLFLLYNFGTVLALLGWAS